MGNFITGVLIQNEDGATYEGVVYDRFLKLQHPRDYVLSIFDPIEPISTNLRVGETYELVLVPFVVSVKHVSISESTLKNRYISSGVWQGIVIDLNWRTSEGSYRLARPELYDREWILLETSLGQVLLNPRSIETVLNKGDIVEWENVRLDLYAVVR